MAVIQYLLWLEKAVPQGHVDEFSGAQQIDAFRWSVLPPGPALPREGQPGAPSTSLPPAAFQGPGAQPWAQLPVYLGQRAQRSAGSLQVWLGQWWAVGRAWWAMGSWERDLIPLPSQPLQREQPDAVCERDVPL